MALDNCYGLCRDESLSLHFYTLEWEPTTLNLYSRLNNDLTSSTRNQSAPKWKFYLHHLLSALRKIPKWISNQDLYRGVAKNLVKLFPEKYVIGETIIWYGFASATTQLQVIEKFLGEGDNESTIFCINGCISGRSIKKFSGHPKESEVLIPAGSQFTIVSIMKMGTVTMIQVKQIPTVEKLLKLE